MKNKKIYTMLIAFMLTIPFRLPISVLLIKLFNYIAQLEGTKITLEILKANVVMTKTIYNVILVSLFVYNLEMLSREIKKRTPVSGSYNTKEPFYWWSGVIGGLFFFYIIFDGYWTSELFNVISK